jgi:hypothetical protein
MLKVLVTSDMIRAVKVLYAASKLLGLAPFITVTNSADYLMYNFSLFSAAYSSCFMSTINVMFFFSLCDWFLVVNHEVSGVISAFHLISVVLSCLMGYYVSFMHCHKILIAVGLINLINTKLSCSSSSCTSIYKTIERHSPVKFLTMATSVMVCGVVTWYYTRFLTSSYLLHLALFIIQLCIISMDLQFCTFVNILKQYFFQLNDQLDRISNSYIMEPLHISPQQSAGFKLPLMTGINIGSLKPQTRAAVSSSPYISSEIYGYLCDLAEIVNSIYAPFLLFSVATDFLVISYSLHVLLSKIICSSAVINYFYFSAYSWSIFYTIKSVYLIYSCSSAKTEVSHWPYYVV